MGHTLISLPSGDLLVMGGENGSGERLSSVEIYLQSTNEWRPVESLPFTGWLGGAVVVDESVIYCAGDGVSKCAVFNVCCEEFEKHTPYSCPLALGHK